MHRFVLNIVTVFAVFCLSQCAKEYSHEDGVPPATGGGPQVVKSEWRFSEGQNRFFGPVDTAYLTDEGVSRVLTLRGKSSDGNEFILIKLKTTDSLFRAGQTYKTTSNEASFLYTNAGGTIYSAVPYKGGEVYVTIMDIGPQKVIASFNGLVIDKNNRSLFIKDGHISSPMIKTAPSTNGGVMLWTMKSCGAYMNVAVNNVPGKIEQSHYSAPDCGEPGTAFYQLPPGIYPWVAYCGTDSLNGTVTVQPGTCSKIFIDFPFIPSPVTSTIDQKTCRISELRYYNNLEHDPRIRSNHIVAEGTVAAVQQMQFYVSPLMMPLKQPVAYNNDTVFLNKGADLELYFILDAKKRVIEYHGSENPGSLWPIPPKTLVKYTYNDQNELIRRQVFDPRYLYLKSETIYTWDKGNIVSTVETNPFVPGYSTSFNFEYYSKEIRGMPFLDFRAFELVFFQPLIYFGNACKNAPSKRITYGISGNKIVYDYDNYVIDANNYVLSCSTRLGEKETVFSFSYNCN